MAVVFKYTVTNSNSFANLKRRNLKYLFLKTSYVKFDQRIIVKTKIVQMLISQHKRPPTFKKILNNL
jgi:hypothetical protein